MASAETVLFCKAVQSYVWRHRRQAQSWGICTLHMQMTLAETLCLHSSLQATKQASAGRPGFELEPTFQQEIWRTDWLLFAPSSLPAEFPEVAEGLSEPLGCSSWGNPLVATHPALGLTLPLALKTILERGALTSLTAAPQLPCSAIKHRTLPLGRDTPLHSGSPRSFWGRLSSLHPQL